MSTLHQYSKGDRISCLCYDGTWQKVTVKKVVNGKVIADTRGYKSYIDKNIEDQHILVLEDDPF